MFSNFYTMCYRAVQYVRRAMSNSEKLELIIVTKSRVLGTPCLVIIIIIIIIIYRFLERHKSLGYRGAGGMSIRRTVGIGKS